MKTEIWKPIKGYESYYMVSNKSEVKRIETYVNHPNGGKKIVRERILKHYVSQGGYISICLSAGKKKTLNLHRIVADAFIPNPENKKCVNHKDGNKHNCSINNLEWVTYSENEKHSFNVLKKKAQTSGLVNQDILNAPVEINGKATWGKRIVQAYLDLKCKGIRLREFSSQENTTIGNVKYIIYTLRKKYDVPIVSYYEKHNGKKYKVFHHR